MCGNTLFANFQKNSSIQNKNNFEISFWKYFSGDENMIAKCFRTDESDQISPQNSYVTLLWGIFYHPQAFLKIFKKSIPTHSL